MRCAVLKSGQQVSGELQDEKRAGVKFSERCKKREHQIVKQAPPPSFVSLPR
jgi:hypothetical protein